MSQTMRLKLAGLLATLFLASVATGQQDVQSAAALASGVSKALQQGDAQGLAELVDFEAHSIDGRARGIVLLDWAKADDTDRLMERQRTVEAWLDSQQRFLEDSFLYGFGELADPDEGQGPLPKRIITQAVLKATKHGQLLDMLVISTPEHRVIELVFGEPYYPDQNPLGPAGLQPLPMGGDDVQGLRWPDDVVDFERQDARELVNELLQHETPIELRRTVEYLHRSPLSGVTALLEALLEEQDNSTPDTAAQEMLVNALTTITGRDSDFRAHADFGMDESSWMSANRAEVMAWLRWHNRHGGNFGVAAIVDPLSPTYGEESPSGAIGLRNPSEHTEKTGSANEPAAPEPSSPTSLPTSEPAAPPEPPSNDKEPGEAVGDSATPSDSPSRVRFRKPETPVVGPLSESASTLTVLKVPPPQHGKPEDVSAASLAEVLPAGIAKSLNRWSGIIDALSLRVAWGGDDEFIVLGQAPDDVLIESLGTLTQSRDLTLEIVPELRSSKTVEPVVVIIIDQSSRFEGFWTDLINGMLEIKALEYEKSSGLRGNPSGFYNRVGHLIVQPTWDVGGDASAGDDEFRLHNELAHKLTGCLAFDRSGHLPEGLFWALGHQAELALFESVYQFNKTGFVSVGDHFDWPRQARQVLERRSRRRNFVLTDQILDSGQMSSDLDGHLIAWAAIDFLFRERPDDLANLFQDLAELHKDARPYGGAHEYEGDLDDTRNALDLRLGNAAVDALIDHLKSRS
ncbi:MAG: hypothetical protein ACI9EF_000861 [Pseudohongiellaceae bacterium]|jgi:hypothetical protein